MLFTCKDFIMECFRDSIGKVPNYQIMTDASKFYKDKLITLDDIVEIHNLIYPDKYIHENVETFEDPNSYIVTY